MIFGCHLVPRGSWPDTDSSSPSTIFSITGGISLKLLEQKDCSRYKASVIVTVYQLIMWSAEPFQAIVDAHLVGYKGTHHASLTNKLSDEIATFTFPYKIKH